MKSNIMREICMQRTLILDFFGGMFPQIGFEFDFEAKDQHKSDYELKLIGVASHLSIVEVSHHLTDSFASRF